MKTAAVASLRRKLAADQPVFGLWVTLESPSLTEMAVALGLDWVVLDAEHGHLDWKDLVEHLRATVRSQTVALIRVAELNVDSERTRGRLEAQAREIASIEDRLARGEAETQELETRHQRDNQTEESSRRAYADNLILRRGALARASACGACRKSSGSTSLT